MKRFFHSPALITTITAILFLSTECLPITAGGNFLSNTTGEAQVKEYLDVIKSGSREKIRGWIIEHYDSSFLQKLPIDFHISMQMKFYFMSAGLGYEFYEIKNSTENELRALVSNKLTGAWLELVIPFNNSAERKINNFIDFKNSAAPASARKHSKLSGDEMIKRLEKCLALLSKNDEFSGAIMFAMNGKPFFKKAVGLSNKSDGIINRIDTKFNIASVGKIFTGVAIAQLVEKGKLSFDDTLSKYLPSDWLSPEISRKLQIKHLLTHTSGLGDYFKILNSQCDKYIFRNLDDYKGIVSKETLEFEPGTRWSYSNTGMLLLGVVIEKITGEDYFEYLRKNIFIPAGMKNTGAFEKDRPVPNRAIGYVKDYSEHGISWVDNSTNRVVKGSPSGGCYSTVEDLLNFNKALLSYKLLNKKFADIVLSPKPEINSPFYGYGFFVSQGNAGRIIRHSGDGTGINSQFSLYIDLGYSVIVLSNYGRPSAEIIDNVLYQMIASED